jgi:hypothetical protein
VLGHAAVAEPLSISQAVEDVRHCRRPLNHRPCRSLEQNENAKSSVSHTTGVTPSESDRLTGPRHFAHHSRLYRTIFPQMTSWLPEEEGAQLRFEFETELARLEAA